ncbi:MAG: NADH:flavin oxidoreductase [Rhodospirillaceae bacterium]|nr:NADH:flavin oxidoreductase [Rhodospirillaceae bacterium]
MPQTAPASQDATIDPLLQPFRLKHLTLKNRIMSTSHACGLVEDGMPSERYQRYHEAKAKGGLALTMFGGSSNVSPESAWYLPQINLYDGRVVEHLRRFSRRIHDHGAVLMCQVSHVGGRGEPYAGAALAPIGPSPVRETLHRAFAKEMDEHDIARVVAEFAEAAARCKEGGLDGIETFAGAHLIGQFLSPATNRRIDKFGGSVENRCRFGLMVHEAIRKRVGDDFIVGIRFVIDEAGPHRISFEDGLKIAAIFEASGTIDFFNAIYGRIDTEFKLAADCMPGMASPEAPFLARAGAFKQAVGLPVFHATRITSLETARRAIRDGLLDMVAMTRAHIADPDLVAKLARGEETRVRPCVGATHCMSPLRPTCIHNPSTGHEAALPHVIEPASTKRRVLVAGGGPAGLEAARVCAERGHDVRLHEASEKLGGQVLLAAKASWRSELTGIVEWRARELKRLGVRVRLKFPVEPSSIEDDVDVVIVATGGVPDLDWIEGSAHCTSVWDVLTGAASAGEDSIVYDGTGRHAALTAAEAIRQAGGEVAFFGLDGQLAMEMSYAEQVIWRRRTYQLGIEPKLDRRLERVEREGNRLRVTFRNELTDEAEEHETGRIVVEHGTRPADALFHGLADRASNRGIVDQRALLAGAPQPEVEDSGFRLFRVGDAVSSRNIYAAVLDAFRLCRTL